MNCLDIAQRLAEQSIRYETEVSLKGLSTFRVGGGCPLAVYPKTLGELIGCVLLLHGENIPYEIVGNGSNLLFSDGRVEKVMIVTREMTEITREGNGFVAECGVSLSRLATVAAEEGLAGLSFAKGIPGTVGGAVYMNAGAYGGEMANVVESTLALDTEAGELFTVEDHEFGYRKSVYMEHPEWVCLAVHLSLNEGNRDEIEAEMKEFAARRREKQPLEFPSAGSYFKRPEGNFAGKLIEDCGLKGLRVGGAAVSEKHAGFLINVGDATAEDVLALEAQVRERVEEQFGVRLEREVRYISSEGEQ